MVCGWRGHALNCDWIGVERLAGDAQTGAILLRPSVEGNTRRVAGRCLRVSGCSGGTVGIVPVCGLTLVGS